MRLCFAKEIFRVRYFATGTKQVRLSVRVLSYTLPARPHSADAFVWLYDDRKNNVRAVEPASAIPVLLPRPWQGSWCPTTLPRMELFQPQCAKLVAEGPRMRAPRVYR